MVSVLTVESTMSHLSASCCMGEDWVSAASHLFAIIVDDAMAMKNKKKGVLIFVGSKLEVVIDV